MFTLFFFFLEWEGPVGDFLKYISEYKNSKKEIFPCVIEDNKIKKDWEWKTHKELDFWQNSQDPSSLVKYDALLKGFHRAFQLVNFLLIFLFFFNYFFFIFSEKYKSDRL